MLAVEFTLYRFVCDLATFTGLFSADSDGRQIPDTAAFVCCWSRLPRTKQSSLNPAQVKQDGTSSNAFFKSLGPDMALTFANAHTNLQLDGGATVLTFQIRPTEFEGGDIPVIAKGTLDPVPYFGKPKKNYAIKLRDASGQVIGKLLFALEVAELDKVSKVSGKRDGPTDDGDSRAGASQPPARRSPSAERKLVARALEMHTATTSTRSQSNHASNSSSASSSSFRGSQKRDSGAVRREGSYASSNQSSSKQRVVRQASPRGGAAPLPVAKPKPSWPNSGPAPPPRPADILTSSDASATYAKAAPPAMQTDGLELVVERISVKPEAIDLDHPAPLLLEAEYYVKVRFSNQTYYTSPVVCSSPKELLFGGQVMAVNVALASDAANFPQPEKLRFSLWENNRQVAGFSLDPDKFRTESDKTKEYAIPFRYHPTQQSACLDVGVRRTTRSSSSLAGGGGGHARAPTQSRTHSNSRQSRRDGDLNRRPSPSESNTSSRRHRRTHSHSHHRHHHHHDRSKSDASSFSAGSVKHTPPPPPELAAQHTSLAPPSQAVAPSAAATAAASQPRVGVSHVQRHADPRPQTLVQERQRSTSSPPPRPTGYLPDVSQQPPQASPPQPPRQPPAAQWVSLAPNMMPSVIDRRLPEQDTPLLWSSASAHDVAGVVGITEPVAPRLVPKRSDSSPRALGVPDSPLRDSSRDRGTPLRSCLPREIDHSGLSAFNDSSNKKGTRHDSLVSRRQQQQLQLQQHQQPTPPRRRSPAKESSVLAGYVATAEQAKRQNAEINIARKESVTLRRSTPAGSRSCREAGEGSERRSRRHTSEHSGGAEDGEHSGSGRRRNRSRSPRHEAQNPSEGKHRSSSSGKNGRRQRPGDGPASHAPADFSEHERYLNQVMSRLNRQVRAPVQRTSLVEEWLGWREEASQRNSRCSSALSDRGRSPSVAGSVISRDDSVASVVSRRATPLPTKSFANYAMQKPYQPEYARPRRTSSVTSLRERPPLVS